MSKKKVERWEIDPGERCKVCRHEAYMHYQYMHYQFDEGGQRYEGPPAACKDVVPGSPSADPFCLCKNFQQQSHVFKMPEITVRSRGRERTRAW